MNYERITKAKARKMYDLGKTVYLLASKMRIGNSWVQPYGINNKELSSFESKLNAYSYYNCNAECGNAIHYYVEK